MEKKPREQLVKFVAQKCLGSVGKKYNFSQVFSVFKRHYKLVPLEVFGSNPYKTLVSTLLSARTNDDTTLVTSKKLFGTAPDFESLSKLPTDKIVKLIYPVGFYKTKARHLKQLSEIILKEHKGRVPKIKSDLVSLPGVGTKTANLVLNRAFGIPAIAVDTHVHRITNMLGWVNSKNPEATEKELVKITPKKYWPDMNRLFVSIGRQYRTRKTLEEFLKENKLISSQE